MEEKKKCPFCGEEIKKEAIKCWHCKKFIQKEENKKDEVTQNEEISEIPCPFCSELIKSTAKKCKHCGEWLNKPKTKKISNKTIIKFLVWGFILYLIIGTWCNLDKPIDCYDQSALNDVAEIYKEQKFHSYYERVNEPEVYNVQVLKYDENIKKYECTAKIKATYKVPNGKDFEDEKIVNYSITRKPDFEDEVFASFTTNGYW